MKKHWRLFPVVFLSIFLVWAVVFHYNSVLQYFIQPAAKVIWLFANLMRAIDQQVFWFLLIVFCIGVFLWFVFKRSDEDQALQKYWGDPAPVRDVDHWTHLIGHAVDSPYIQRSLVKNLLDLQRSIDELATGHGQEQASEVKPALRKWQLPVDDDSISVPASDIIPGMKQRRMMNIQKNTEDVITGLEEIMETKDGKKENQ